MGSRRASPVYVDTREAGAHIRYGVNHGIARYAREVIPRLTIQWVAFDRPFRPSTPMDALNPNRARLPSSALLYSPGYSAGLARCTQLLTIHDLTHLRTQDSRLSHVTRVYYEGVVKPAVRRARHVLTVSETSADEIRNWLDDDSVTVHNAGIGCSSAYTREGPASTFDRPYFLYVGNFKPHKNPRPLFEAMTSFQDHLLVVVSADADVAAVRALAGQYGLNDRLRIRTAVSDEALAALYRGSDALVFPSVWEGFGLPVLEALMTGTKVVYFSGAASVSEICQHGQFAVENSSDAREFSSQMALAIDSSFTCPTDLTQFRWETVAAKVESLIRHFQHRSGVPKQESRHP
ncbi:glycosyltransferase [Mycobacterium sp. JS623]|nr:glycosyltransferase [Mycobacterium sp. JS623]